METSLGVEAREVPFEDDSVTVHALVPSLSLRAQGGQVGDSAFAQTKEGLTPDFLLRGPSHGSVCGFL